MEAKIKIAAIAISIVIISGCSNDNSKTSEEIDQSTMNQAMGEMNHSNMMPDMMEGHMSHDQVIRLNDSTGENELKIPAVLEKDKGEGIVYTVRAQKGKTEIFDGTESVTYGYNGPFLGPMLRFEKGDTVKIKTIN
ncbi:multicopper oxidase domain-containing protein, partial [Sporosarcina sp. NCCP-2331]